MLAAARRGSQPHGASGQRSGKIDQIASNYSALHEQSVQASGESIEYFAEYKINCLRRWGAQRQDAVLDYGCGIGNLTSLLVRNFDSVTGYDPSLESLRVAQQRIPEATFVGSEASLTDGSFQIAILAGVLHHIPPAERVAVLETTYRKLAPGGRLFIFEHNPWNPVTRRAVDACPFDDDAILLPPGEARSLPARAGFSNTRQKFIVFFPRILSALRFLEPALGFCPLGAQTMTIAERAVS